MKKTLGIIGGMGPLATAVLFRRIVELTDANSDRDHIRIFIDNNSSIPDRTKHLVHGGEDSFPEILKSLKKLEQVGAEVIIMPCNTAHYTYPRLVKQSKIPIISIIDTVTNEIKNKAYLQDGLALLGTEGTRVAQVYENKFKEEHIAYYELNDEEQNDISLLIYDIKKEGVTSKTTNDFKLILTKLQKKGLKHFILACTELALMEEVLDKSNAYINSIDLLAKEAIRFCGYKVKEEINK